MIGIMGTPCLIIDISTLTPFPIDSGMWDAGK